MKRQTKQTNKTKSELIKVMGALLDLYAQNIEKRELPGIMSPAHKLAVEYAMQSGMHTERGKLQPPVAGLWTRCMHKLRGGNKS